LLGDHTGQIGQPHQHFVILARGQAGGDLDRLRAVGLVDFVPEILQLDRGKRKQPTQLGQGLIGVVQAVGDHIDPELDPVGGELGVVAIEDRAAPRRDQGEVDPVAFSCGLVLLVLDQRDPAQPRSQQHAQPGLQSADQKRAALETVPQRA
jgi:hypothetical protein